jgi:putative thioredoxin
MMTTQSGRAPQPAFDLRGAVDLGAVAARAEASRSGADKGSSGAGGGAAGGHVVEATDATFVEQVIEISTTVPVVVDFWAPWCQPCRQLSPLLEKLAEEYDGRFLLVTIDVDANPQVSGAFQVQSIPSVYAVLKGQPVPLFQGAQPEAQIRQVLSEVFRVAEANGVTGRHEAAVTEPEPVVEQVDEPLPARHQEAYDAIDRGDFDAAVAAYEAALREDPTDDLARVGLAQVGLLRRTQDVDLAAARDAAAAEPLDVEAQLLVADLDVLGGHVEDAFARLIDTVRKTAGAERNSVRERLLELFEVVGSDDPRVTKARVSLASALF